MINKTLAIVISCVGIASIILVSFYLSLDKKIMEAMQNEQANDFKCWSGFKPGVQDDLVKPESVNGADNNTTHDVIVIGAGAAGLEAAKQLHSKGMDVIVLEGRDRIGGRVWTTHYDGASLDLGGSWIHGLNKGSSGFENPLYQIVSNNNIKFNETSQTVTLYDSSGHKIDDDSSDLYDKYDKFATKYDETLSEDQRKQLSAQDVINKYYTSIGPMDKAQLAKYRYTMYWQYDMDQAVNTTELGFENSLGNQYFNGDEENEGIFPYGYNQIVNCLAGGLVIKHANVTKVDYTSLPIVVTTNKGTFKAYYAISTLPLGVLQKNTVEFHPPLDSDKAEAINHLKMATMDKVYLIFNDTQDPFWMTESSWINRIPDVENNTYKETDKKWQFFFNLYKYDHKPILLAFNTDGSANKLENESDAEIKNEVMVELRSMYNHTYVPEPEKIIRTTWAMDPLSFGSYSIIPVNGSLDDFDKLAKPVDNKLFFAGEATNKYYYGTVHGAYISGYRAAEEILKLKDKVDSPKLDSPIAQLEHGIKRWDIICGNGSELKNGIYPTENVTCVPIHNAKS